MKSLKKTSKELVDTSKDVSSEIEKKSQILTFDLKDTGIAYRVLQAPLVSEKSTFLAGNNQYVFKVGIDVTRAMVKSAIEKVYGVRPIKVNIISMDGKLVRFRGRYGKRKNWKKAIVMLPKDSKISIFDGI
jgi:large subunit ribosomal protein L23